MILWIALAVVLSFPAAMAGTYAVAQRRSWRLGRVKGLHWLMRFLPHPAGWCERCETSYRVVTPRLVKVNPNAAVGVLCLRCWYDLDFEQRLNYVARWWVARPQTEERRGTPELGREWEEIRYAVRVAG